MELTLTESRDEIPGAESVRLRLSELMFVEVIRRHVAALPPEQAGWLAGLRDEYIGRALGLLHERAAHGWTLDELASDVGLSRSAFADRFTRLVGEPPMQYLTRWRMQMAARLLTDGSAKVAAIAVEVGLRLGGGVQPRVQEDRRRRPRPRGASAGSNRLRPTRRPRRSRRGSQPASWRTPRA